VCFASTGVNTRVTMLSLESGRLLEVTAGEHADGILIRGFLNGYPSRAIRGTSRSRPHSCRHLETQETCAFSAGLRNHPPGRRKRLYTEKYAYTSARHFLFSIRAPELDTRDPVFILNTL